jgi:hypothetical protein
MGYDLICRINLRCKLVHQNFGFGLFIGGYSGKEQKIDACCSSFQ